MTSKLIVVLATALFTGAALAQNTTPSTANDSPAPVAYLYFSVYEPGHDSLTPGKARTQIEAYSVAPDGSLTKIPGSPFAKGGYTTQICVNGKYLFATTHLEQTHLFPGKINSYKIESDGALKLSHVLGDATLTNITLDHTGDTFYGQKYGFGDLLSYKVRWSDGGLEYLGQVTAPDLEYAQPWENMPVTFSGDNNYVFGTSEAGYPREASGRVVKGWSANVQPPSFAVAADPDGNLAGITQLGNDSEGFQQFGVASYQIASDGTLTSTSTADNMPTFSKAYEGLAMSPSGKFFAVGAFGTVNVYNWNGADPATPFATLQLPDNDGGETEIPGTAVILQWDNANHLFAYVQGFTPSIDGYDGFIYVWTVTDSGVTSAPGSPLGFHSPISVVAVGPGMAVQALTPQTD